MPVNALTAATQPELSEITARLSGSPCILLLDIDGTLAPLASRPSEARIPDETREVLQRLANRPDMRLALISGRSAADARQMAALGDGPVWIIGNHGIETSDPGGAVAVHPAVSPYASAVSAAAVRASAIAREVPGAVLEDKRWTLSVHYRLVDDRVVPQLLGAIRDVASSFGLRATLGKRVVELRPPVAVNKGTASLDFARRAGGLMNGSSGLCAGDDQTDEDAFAALRTAWPKAVTIRVGHSDHLASTSAEWELETPAALLPVLRWLADR